MAARSPVLLFPARAALRVALTALALMAVAAVGPAPAVALGRPSAQLVELGDHGPAVWAVQRALARATFLPGPAADGRFGWRTWHAVVAFQGWSHLGRDGVVGPLTRAALSRSRRPVPWSRRAGFEVHVARQVLLMVRDGHVVRAVHVSTGAGGATPVGHFRVMRRERLSWSARFGVWMPYAQYFCGGYAMHEYPDVPGYPASHGCIRVPHQEAVTVWRFGRLGMRLWTR